MLCVCFVQKDKNSIMNSLAHKLSVYYNIFMLDRKFSYQKGSGQPLVFFNSKATCELETESCILVFDEDSKLQLPHIACKNIVAVVSSSNRSLINELSRYNMPVITCGASQKDTVTYSSFTGEKAVISLQRSIISFSGKTIEPFEISVEMDENDSIFCALAFAALLAQFDTFESSEPV